MNDESTSSLMPEEFGNQLRRFRETFDYTQSEAAALLGISKNYVSALENGKKNASMALEEKLEQLRKSSLPLPSDWTSGYIFDRKPSQRINTDLEINWSTKVVFVIKLDLSDITFSFPDEQGFYSSGSEDTLFTPQIDLASYEEYKTEDNKYIFYDPEEVNDFIMKNTLVIKDVFFENNNIIVEVRPIEIPLADIYYNKFRVVFRKLNRHEADIAAALVSSRYDNWFKKVTWKKPLPTMVWNGVQQGIFRAYGYILESANSSTCISYIDAKQRVDTALELGTLATHKQFTGRGLGNSLIWMVRLKYIAHSFWIGTSQQNKSMLSTLKKQKSFKPFMFQDKEGNKGHRVKERIVLDKEGKQTLSESVYFCCPSILELLCDSIPHTY